MTAYRIIPGDCIDGMRTLAAESVQCCVTSPPYWGLRDYGVDGQIGLESTPEQYVASMVEVFREVRRVLREDGTVWLNLGDSYMGGGRGGGADNCKQRTNVGSLDAVPNLRCPGFKPKDLVGIPWRVAFALQADGWWLRQDIIWHKPNPMPESVTDRCTKAHEYIFLLSKSARYYYDGDAIQEPFADERMGNPGGGGRYVREVAATGFRNDGATLGTGKWNEDGSHDGRNRRSVWTVPTSPYPEAHFATFPPALIEPCILAGCPVDGTVLDPFTGSGTTGAVALKHGRRFVGCELNPEYIKLAEKRIGAVVSEQALFRQESAA